MNEIRRIGADPGKRILHVTAADAKGALANKNARTAW